MNKVKSPPEQPQLSNRSSSPDLQPVKSQEELTIHEINGPKGPEPTRFGDWERKGRCIDF